MLEEILTSNSDYIHRQSNKFFRIDNFFPENHDERSFRGTMNPMIENGYYENVNLYEEEIGYINPGKRFVKMNHSN